MNQNNRSLELSINRLALTLESLEEYVRHADYYSDRKSKEQFYRRVIQDSNKWDLENDEECLFSNLYLTRGWFKHNPESVQIEVQKEFYKWIDHSGITAENCPEKLKHYLNELNEILEGRGENFYQACKAKSKEEWKKIEELVKSPVFSQASREVNRFFFAEHIPIKSIKIREAKIVGNAEQGQKTFQEIKNSIASQHEWTFLPFGEKYLPRLAEKIKELEEKKDRLQPKEEWKREINLESFDEHTLMSLELYIQKLDYYPDWKTREWTEEDREDWRKNWENK